MKRSILITRVKAFEYTDGVGNGEYWWRDVDAKRDPSTDYEELKKYVRESYDYQGVALVRRVLNTTNFTHYDRYIKQYEYDTREHKFIEWSPDEDEEV